MVTRNERTGSPELCLCFCVRLSLSFCLHVHLKTVLTQVWLPSLSFFSLSEFFFFLLTLPSPPDLHTDASEPEMTVTAYSSPYYSCHIIPVSISLSSLSVRIHTHQASHRLLHGPLLSAQICTIRQAAASLIKCMGI